MFKFGKWQLITIILCVALAVSIGFNLYQAFNDSYNPSNFTYTPNSPLTVEATNYPLRLSMTINKTEFKLREPISMIFTLKNIGNKTLTLVFSCGRDRKGFRVYNERGREVYSSLRHTLYPHEWVPTKMLPGEEVGGLTTWYQEVEPYQNFHLGKAPPGTYHIIGEFISISLNLTIRTPPITIKIVE